MASGQFAGKRPFATKRRRIEVAGGNGDDDEDDKITEASDIGRMTDIDDSLDDDVALGVSHRPVSCIMDEDDFVALGFRVLGH